MKLAAVVVLYNPTEENINNINNYSDSVDKIYVVDNSEDEIIRLKNNKIVRYLKLSKNEGIAYALNLGAKNAIKDNFNYLLTLDQDTKMTSNTINKMKEFIVKHKEDKIGLVSPYQDIGSNESVTPGVEELIEVMTSGNIIDLSAYQEIGGFKDWFFIDCVDTEYCMNLNCHGYKVLRLNDLIIKHNLGELKIHRLFGKDYYCYNHNPIRRYYIMRNNLYINQLYGEIYPDYCSWLLRVQRGQIKGIIIFERHKIKKLFMMFRGYLDYKKGIKNKLM